MTDQLLGLLTTYGVPALFGILLVTSVGAPFPIMFVLIAAGSFVAQGEMSLWQVLVFGSAGAVLGDQIGYALGRWGGPGLIHRITSRVGGAQSFRRAEAMGNRFGSMAIFFTRWLVTPLGPWVNLTSGITAYSWPRFVFWDVLGETIWVVLYVLLGKTFSDRVQELTDLFGNLVWVIAGTLASIVLGFRVFRYFHAGGR